MMSAVDAGSAALVRRALLRCSSSLALALPRRGAAPRSRRNTRPPNDITAAEATAAAAKDPNVLKEQAEHPRLFPSPTFHNEKWEVGWFEDDHEYALAWSIRRPAK